MLFNNGMRIGSTSPYPENVNYVRPGQIPLLNNSPVIVLKDGKLKLAMGTCSGEHMHTNEILVLYVSLELNCVHLFPGAGTPGGEAIGQTQFQCIMNVLDFGLTVQEAIETPRFRLAASPNFYKPGNAVSMSLETRVSEGSETPVLCLACGFHGGCFDRALVVTAVEQLRAWGHDVKPRQVHK